jgi:lipopolysaccharide export system protein LptA
MKKKVWLSSLIALLLFFAFSFGVFAAPKLTMWYNNKAQKTDVRLINNKPYVPLNDVATLFGGKVTYDKKTNTYKVTSKDFNPNPVTTKSYKVNVTKTSGPTKFTISNVTVNPKYKSKLGETYAAVILDVKVQNTSADKVSWHPTQGTYALNTGEQVDQVQTLFNSDDVSGDFLKGAIKTGKIVLKVTRTIDKVNSININITGPFNDDLDRLGEDLLFDVKFR